MSPPTAVAEEGAPLGVVIPPPPASASWASAGRSCWRPGCFRTRRRRRLLWRRTRQRRRRPLRVAPDPLRRTHPSELPTGRPRRRRRRQQRLGSSNGGRQRRRGVSSLRRSSSRRCPTLQRRDGGVRRRRGGGAVERRRGTATGGREVRGPRTVRGRKAPRRRHVRQRRGRHRVSFAATFVGSGGGGPRHHGSAVPLRSHHWQGKRRGRRALVSDAARPLRSFAEGSVYPLPPLSSAVWRWPPASLGTAAPLRSNPRPPRSCL